MRNTIMEPMMALLVGACLAFVGCESDDGDDGESYIPTTYDTPTQVSFTGTWRLTDQRDPGTAWILELTETASTAQTKTISGVLYVQGQSRRYDVVSPIAFEGTEHESTLPLRWSIFEGAWQGRLSVEYNGEYETCLDVKSISGNSMNGIYDGNTGNPWTAVRI